MPGGWGIIMRQMRCGRWIPGLLIGALCALPIGICSADGAPQPPGADLYAEFCSSCHGIGGHGDGPVATSLKRKVPDLTLLAQRHGGVFPAAQVHRIVDGRSVPRAHGSLTMPVWGREFFGFEPDDATHRRRVAELIDQLVEYLNSIQEGAR